PGHGPVYALDLGVAVAAADVGVDLDGYRLRREWDHPAGEPPDQPSEWARDLVARVARQRTGGDGCADHQRVWVRGAVPRDGHLADGERPGRHARQPHVGLVEAVELGEDLTVPIAVQQVDMQPVASHLDLAPVV